MSDNLEHEVIKVRPTQLLSMLLSLWLLVACSSGTEILGTDSREDASNDPQDSLALPKLEPIPSGGDPLQVVATTGIVGDVVAQIAGSDAALSVLMAPEQDPHGYQATAGDLRQAADADVIFVNGWGLEEGLLDDLGNAADGTALAPVSAGLEPRYFDDDTAGGGQEGKDIHSEQLRIDPHVWLAPSNVVAWVKNIEEVLGTLDPGNAPRYAKRARAYESELTALDNYYEQMLAPVAPGDRVLVTNHDAFGYFADAYKFNVVGTIVSGDSTLSEPSSRDLASLSQSMREGQICAIFVERSASQQLAEQLAGELDHCENVKIVTLYSGALGAEGSGAETYLQMMRANIDAIADSLPKSASESNGG
ncbi:MAG: zinc ABC transporter substrate-binding protein [Chloroflexota bacterium]|nr:MAG: zinc ABC transporter substrate-binding protein [Chloroflexota bacterium]